MPSLLVPHRLRVIASATLVATLATLPSACGETEVAGPAETLGHWELVSIDNEPVAGKQALAEEGAWANIDSGEVIFRRYGRVQDIRHLWRQPLFGPPIFFSDTMIVTYIVRRDSIFITRERVATSETYVDTGRIEGDLMEVAVRWSNPATNQFEFPLWRYYRVGDTPP